jgi:hypothetical protein
MAAPALQKTWQGGSTLSGTELVNVVVPGVHPKEVLFAVKTAKIGFNSNPWTVIGSSDGVGASMDGTDRWVDSGDIISWSPGNPRPWIVLQQTALGATFHCLLATLDTTADFDGNDIVVIYNDGGFGTANGGADGDASTLPTPSDTSKNFSPPATDWCGAEGGAPTAKVLTCLSSTDGECTRFLISKQSTGLPINMWGIEVPRLPPAEWTVPVVTYMFKSTVASGLSCLRWETMQATGANMRGLVGAQGGGVIAAGMVPMGPMFSSTEVIDFQEDDRPNPMLYPVRLWGGDYGGTSNNPTILNHGTLFDWYWCSRNVAGKHLLDMDTVPAPQDATPQSNLFFRKDTGSPVSVATITHAAQTGLVPTSITLECWIYILEYGPNPFKNCIVRKMDGFAQGYELFHHSDGRVNFRYKETPGFNQKSWVSVAGTSALNTWVHVAVTYDQATGNTKFFTNGAQLGGDNIFLPGNAILHGTAPLEVGASGNILSYDFDGYQADLRIWSHARTPAEILASYNTALVGDEVGLEGYWPFHTDLLDLTANGNDLTAVAGGTVPAPTVNSDVGRPYAGDIIAPRTLVCTGDNVIGWLDDSVTDLNYAKALTIENALRLDNGEYLTLANGAYAGLNSFSVEMWIKMPTGTPNAWRGVYGSGDSHWQCYVVGEGTLSTWGDKGSASVLYDHKNDVWEHWAWVFSTTTMTIFVNGVQILSPVAVASVVPSTGLVHLGNTPAGGSILADATSTPVHMADVRHWNFARSGAQILADYQTPLSGSETGLVAYWPLQTDFSQLVGGGPTGWSTGAGTPTIENGVGPVL